MIHTDVIIVGGGPAGAACARRLTQLDINCIVLDQRPFPRFKPCAGWIPPGVFRSLDMDSGSYPFSLTTFKSFQISIRGIKFQMPTHQYAIHRYEFDDWLLHLVDVEFYVHAVKTITLGTDRYIIDGEFSGKYLVGAGGTRCPVYQTLFQPVSPRERCSLIVAQEEEFPYEYNDERCHLWFMENGLPGYAWYVPKASGYVNIGVGGKAEQLKKKGDTLKNHWNLLLEKLEKSRLIQGHVYNPVGHSYYLRGKHPVVSSGNAYIIGDAAGLATRDMGEGIGPAIQSGIMAANAIHQNTSYIWNSIPMYSFPSITGFIK